MKQVQESAFFIFITNNCNLKCLGCMQSCDRTNNPYYMSIEELENNLQILQKKNFTINNLQINKIYLTGGDPLTHPQIINFCILINKYLPKIPIVISTNGLFLNKFSDNQLIELYQKYNVIFQLSIYADINLLKMYKKIKKRFDDLNILFSFNGYSNFYFHKQDKMNYSYNRHKTTTYTEKCKQKINILNEVILYKNKIYSCWKDINIILKEKDITINNDDNYKLDEVISNELIQNKKHYYCNICKYYDGSGGQEYILWQHHNKNADKIFNSTLKDLFIYDYPLYYDLQHNCKHYKEILQDELFLQHYPEEQKKYSDIRFFNGKGDIFIPFKKNISYEFTEFLSNIDNIEQYNFYFVSIDNLPEIENDVYNSYCPFNNDKIKSYFLKADNMLQAYNTFLNNSYLHNKFTIDLEQNDFELLPLN